MNFIKNQIDYSIVNWIIVILLSLFIVLVHVFFVYALIEILQSEKTIVKLMTDRNDKFLIAFTITLSLALITIYWRLFLHNNELKKNSIEMAIKHKFDLFEMSEYVNSIIELYQHESWENKKMGDFKRHVYGTYINQLRHDSFLKFIKSEKGIQVLSLCKMMNNKDLEQVSDLDMFGDYDRYADTEKEVIKYYRDAYNFLSVLNKNCNSYINH